MKKIFEKTSFKIFVLIATFCSTLLVCFLLFFFIKDIDQSYNNLLEKEIGARTLIQSIFSKRLSNYANILKIEKAENADTAQKYFNKWHQLSAEIGNDFIKLQHYVPKDSITLKNSLQEIIAKRNLVVQQTKDALTQNQNSVITKVNSIDISSYNESISVFLNNYNDYLLNTSNAITKHTLLKSNLYLSILPIPLVLIFLFFGQMLVLYLRDIALDGKK